jgi:hypothetical protein
MMIIRWEKLWTCGLGDICNDSSGVGNNIYGSDWDNINDSGGSYRMMIFVRIMMVTLVIK